MPQDSEPNPSRTDAGRPSPRPWRAAALLALGLALLAGAAAQAEYTPITPADCGTGCRPGDELWMVSTRGLASVDCGGTFEPTVSRYHAAEGWQSSQLHDLLSAATLPTLIYVHGNRMTGEDATASAWDLYYALTRWYSVPTFRLIVWSWPSQQIPGVLRDVRVKADRADMETFYLAEFLGRLPANTSLSLFGYSFGCRIIAGGLHLVGGGELYGRTVATAGHWSQRAAETRAVFFAPALEDIAFASGAIYARAVANARQILVLYNPSDPVLKRYHLLDNCRDQRAMGYHGASGDFSGEVVWEKDVGPWIGRTHNLANYLNSPEVIGTAGRYGLFPTP